MPRSIVIGHWQELLTIYQNDYTEQCIGVLRHISALNIDLVSLPTSLSQLQSKLHTKNNFSHIQHLHNMLYCYGSTVVETHAIP